MIVIVFVVVVVMVGCLSLSGFCLFVLIYFELMELIVNLSWVVIVELLVGEKVFG